MGKKLAIKGHSTRGEEVIKLLEMLGGVAVVAKGNVESYCYYIAEDSATKYIFWDYIGPEEIDKYEIFTLEEFLDKFPYKVGDKVHIYVQNDDIDGRYDMEVAEITSMRWNPARRKIAYKMKDINREFYKEEIKCKVDDSNKQSKVMGKKLAIKSHITRGKEVIELLNMMGGCKSGYRGGGMGFYYYISQSGNIEGSCEPHDFDNYIVYTLEEFLEKYPFKVGDKVVDCYGNSITIKSMEWSEDCETMVYDFKDSVIVLAAEDLLKYNAELLVNKEKSEEVGKMLCDTTLNHLHRISLKNVLSELYEHIKSTSKEELEREFKEIESEGWTNVGPTVEEFMDFCNKVNKKPVYPKTYDECCKVLRKSPEFLIKYSVDGNDTEGDAPLIKKFIKLKRCRDAYWKIVGMQMGLGKPWKPDWLDETTKYGIHVYQNVVIKDNFIRTNCVLVFPTPEIRDEFYENFKDLIESCKELI